MKGKKLLILIIFLFFLTDSFFFVSAQETTKAIELDGDPDPEFIIHWRYSDFPNNARADTVVNLVETAAREAWQII